MPHFNNSVVICFSQHSGQPYCNHPCYAAKFGPKGNYFSLLVKKRRNKKSRIYGTSDSFAKINLICQICQRVRSVRESDL